MANNRLKVIIYFLAIYFVSAIGCFAQSGNKGELTRAKAAELIKQNFIFKAINVDLPGGVRWLKDPKQPIEQLGDARSLNLKGMLAEGLIQLEVTGYQAMDGRQVTQNQAILSVTDKGKQFIDGDDKGMHYYNDIKNKDGSRGSYVAEHYKITVAIASFGKITGIRKMDSNTAVVEFTQNVKLLDNPFTKYFTQAIANEGNKKFSVTFVLYDDGWRILR